MADENTEGNNENLVDNSSESVNEKRPGTVSYTHLRAHET